MKLVIPAMSIKPLKKATNPPKTKTPKKTPQNLPKPWNKPFQNISWGFLADCFRLDVDTVKQCTLGWNSHEHAAQGCCQLPITHIPTAQVLSPQPHCLEAWAPLNCGAGLFLPIPPSPSQVLNEAPQGASLSSALRLFETPSYSFELL